MSAQPVSPDPNTSQKRNPLPSTPFNPLRYTQPTSTDFWGPVSNFGIPVAAVMDTQKDPELFVPRPPQRPYTSALRLSKTTIGRLLTTAEIEYPAA